MKGTVASLLALAAVVHAGMVVVNPAGPFPDTTESGQYGTNNCGTKDSPTANCQTLIAASNEDFCLWSPPKEATVGDDEGVMVSWCTMPGHGSRLIPKGALTGVHFIETPHYIQITGTGDFTKMNIPKGDEGGELDPHGATGEGNPIGGIVIATLSGKKTQIMQWTQFISDSEFCIRMCVPGADAAEWCQHIYDVMGCYWNLPGNYNEGSFDNCKANDVAMPMGLYLEAGGKTSTFYQGEPATPAAQNPAKSSDCKAMPSLGGKAYATAKARRSARGH